MESVYSKIEIYLGGDDLLQYKRTSGRVEPWPWNPVIDDCDNYMFQAGKL